MTHCLGKCYSNGWLAPFDISSQSVPLYWTANSINAFFEVLWEEFQGCSSECSFTRARSLVRALMVYWVTLEQGVGYSIIYERYLWGMSSIFSKISSEVESGYNVTFLMWPILKMESRHVYLTGMLHVRTWLCCRLWSWSLNKTNRAKTKVYAGVGEKCRDHVPIAPGFVLITAIMFILL